MTPPGDPPSDGFSSGVLTIERQGPVATLWLDRPEKRNAMGLDFWHDLPVAMDELSGDDEVRVVVVAARGAHFSVGLDLHALAELGGLLAGAPGETADPPSAAARARSAHREILRLQAAITSVADCPKPVIACVHGYCLGGGVDLISACDIRVASADAVFSVRETKMAMVADLGSLQRLPGIVGTGHVAELVFTGKDVPASRARDIGLVNDVAPDADGALVAARALAEEIAAGSPLAVQGAKAVLRFGAGGSVAAGLGYVAAWNAGHLASDDLTEAVTAFFEKRPPRFTGR